MLGGMTFAPRQNWNAYNDALRDRRGVGGTAESRSTELPNLTELSNLEAEFFRYASFFDAIQLARRELHHAAALDLSHERQSRWTMKLESRRRLIAAYQAMDSRRDE